MKSVVATTVRTLFVISLGTFLLTATAMVLLQVLGLILLQPGLVTTAYETLIRPSIVASVVTGFIGLLAFYTAPTDQKSPQG